MYRIISITDVFAPLIDVAMKSALLRREGAGFVPSTDAGPAIRHVRNMEARSPGGNADTETILAALRVISDHARSVAFLLADGVYPSNDGRGYVLRRILRRAVRYAWLLGKRDPMLVDVVGAVIETMSGVYPELRQRAKHIVETTRAEEERFLTTIEGGMRRFEEFAPLHTTRERSIAGEDAFKLYDTYGFPIDLTELMAREREYTVDIPGFERALAGQRTQSQEERKSRKLGVAVDELADLSSWTMSGSLADVRFVGYDRREAETDVVGVRALDGGRVAVLLREMPFYAESGGQVSDLGEIVGEGWRIDIDDVRKVDGKPVAIGKSSGDVTAGTRKRTCPARSPFGYGAQSYGHAFVARRAAFSAWRTRPSGGIARVTRSSAI